MPLILSDLHLGLSPLEIRDLEPVLDLADELWLNGDAVETRHARYRDRGLRLWGDLQRTCARRGVTIRRLSGNHDHDDALPMHLELGEGRILVTHGHAFLPCIAPWSVWAAEAERRHRACLQALPPSERDTFQAALLAAASAAEAAWSDPTRERRLHAAAMLTRPWAVMAVLRTWMRWPGLAHAFVARHRPAVRLLISGHSHRRGVHRCGSLVIMDTGSFNPPARAAAVLVQERQACWIPITRRGGRHTPASESRWIRVSV
jgi:predicted phosphodiesterase